MYLLLHFPTHAVLSASNVSITASKAQNIVEYFSTWQYKQNFAERHDHNCRRSACFFYGVIELTEAGYTFMKRNKQSRK